MRDNTEIFSLILVLGLILASLNAIIIEPVFAQSIATPVVPQFSVKYSGLFYDPLAAVDNRTLFFTIRNQPFTQYNDSGGTEIGMYYNFRVKDHSGDQWYYYPFGPNGASTWLYGIFDMASLSNPFFNASNSGNTTLHINFYSFFDVQTFPGNSQLDIQVQALIGQVNIVYTGLRAGNGYNFTGNSSSWSKTQTISLTEGATSSDINSAPYATISTTPSPTASPAPNPSIPELSWIVIVFLLLSVFSVALAIKHQRTFTLRK